jgi:hypothetical protein
MCILCKYVRYSAEQGCPSSIFQVLLLLYYVYRGAKKRGAAALPPSFIKFQFEFCFRKLYCFIKHEHVSIPKKVHPIILKSILTAIDHCIELK